MSHLHSDDRHVEVYRHVERYLSPLSPTSPSTIWDRGLSDGINQGAAGPDQFRTAPLWGLGQRLFFLHDGRTSDLLQAIQAHASNGSEANDVIRRFNSLNRSQMQDVLNFLRSL